MKPSLYGNDHSAKMEAFNNGLIVCDKCGRQAPVGELEALEGINCSSCKNLNFIPKKLGNFWLYFKISSKSNAIYYKACHEQFPYRTFAVKTLPRNDIHNPNLIENLKLEADILYKLGEHPCLFAGIESGYEDGEHYLAMEFVDGESLDSRLKGKGPLQEVEALLIILRILSADTYIYNRGYLYGNIEPKNIIISEYDGAYIYDYGSCLPIGSARKARVETDNGSLLYASPERFLGEAEGPSSELYSLGMVFYHMLTGETYFSAKELKRLGIKLKGEYLTLSKTQTKMKDISTDIGEIITKMIKRMPEQRYQNFSDVEMDVLEALNTRF